MRLIFGFLTLVSFVLSSSPPDPGEILIRVGETYASLKSYDFNIEAHAVFEFQGVKYQFSIPQEMAQGDVADQQLSIVNKPFRISRVDGIDQDTSPIVNFSPPGTLYYDFSRISQNLKYAKFLREESLQSNGKPAACYVVELLRIPDINASPLAPAVGPETLWIDKVSSLVLRTAFHMTYPPSKTQPALQIDWHIVFASYALNQTPPQWLLDGKKMWEKQQADWTAKMVGTSAPEFQLEDIDGRQVSLQSFHDNIVLLDFWASWCGPCRRELPILVALERKWSSKGLIILRITDEPPEYVRAFFKRTQQTFPTLINGQKVSRQFSVPGLPTLVLIDKARKIVAYDVSELSESDLTSRLKRAGLE